MRPERWAFIGDTALFLALWLLVGLAWWKAALVLCVLNFWLHARGEFL